MATTKLMLVLANSIKHWPCTCIAGREIEPSGSSYSIGPWIRPVSTHGEGELSLSESCLPNGKQPTVMDFVEVHLDKQIEDPLQPENWLIDTSNGWKSANELYDKPSMDLLVESPENIWLEPDGRNDRVSAKFLNDRTLKSSLCLIHVPSIRARFEWNEWDGRFKQRRRALFHYRKHDYEINITDPLFSERYRDQFPSKGQPPNSFKVQPTNGCYLCISLAPEWRDYHYKVVATILEC